MEHRSEPGGRVEHWLKGRAIGRLLAAPTPAGAIEQDGGAVPAALLSHAGCMACGCIIRDAGRVGAAIERCGADAELPVLLAATDVSNSTDSASTVPDGPKMPAGRPAPGLAATRDDERLPCRLVIELGFP